MICPTALTLVKVELHDDSHEVFMVPIVGMYMNERQDVYYIIDEGDGPFLLKQMAAPGYAYALYTEENLSLTITQLLLQVKSWWPT